MRSARAPGAPKPAEVTTILELLRSRDARIAEAGYRRAEVSVGDSKLPGCAGTNPRQLAGWTIVSRPMLQIWMKR